MPMPNLTNWRAILFATAIGVAIYAIQGVMNKSLIGIILLIVVVLAFSLLVLRPALRQYFSSPEERELRQSQQKVDAVMAQITEAKAQRAAGQKKAAQAAYGLGLIAEINIELVKARDYYQQALELDPEHKKARACFDKLDAYLKAP